MGQVLIIGYGNPLRGDDGVGWHAALRLASAVRKCDVEILARHQLTPELAEPVSRAGLVVFVDAETGGPAGRISCRSITARNSCPLALSHEVTPQAVLGWAAALYGAFPPALLFTVSAQSFACGQELSAPVADAMPELIAQICSALGLRGQINPGLAR